MISLYRHSVWMVVPFPVSCVLSTLFFLIGIEHNSIKIHTQFLFINFPICVQYQAK
nr:MAG TPA: hypothetical protein [Caudoviricetes sp.]